MKISFSEQVPIASAWGIKRSMATRPSISDPWRLRHAVHRGNAAQAELDANQIRLEIEYPLGGKF